jgi:hypothetical protein
MKMPAMTRRIFVGRKITSAEEIPERGIDDDEAGKDQGNGKL